MLKVRNIDKSFGRNQKVLNDVSFDLNDGEFCVILGPSGSGKSTLLYIIGGMDSADHGTVEVDGVDITGFNPNELTEYRREKIGFVFQLYNLMPKLTVRENIRSGAYLSDNPIDIDRIIGDLSLEEHENKLPGQLSGGQMQRCAVGRALSKNPSLLLCDEPTGALDSKSSKDLMIMLENLNKSYGTTILIVTHNEIIIGMGIVIGGAVGNLSIVKQIESSYRNSNLSDGEFSLLLPASDELKSELKSRYGISIEKQWYMDLPSLDKSTLRVFKDRDRINKVSIFKGKKAVNYDEVVIEKNFGLKHKLKIGSIIKIGSRGFKITGLGISPDYCYVKRNLTDFTADSEKFGTAFVTEKGFEKIAENLEAADNTVYQYSFKNPEKMENSKIIDLISKNSVITSYTDSKTNSRINAYSDNCGVMYKSSLISGVVFFILIGYVLSVFTGHRIERERKQIGTLFALGYRKREILRHYMILPLSAGLAASIAGTLIGFFVMAKIMTQDSITTYSLPEISFTAPAGIITYSILMPALIIILATGIGIMRELRERPLNMIRNIQETGKPSKYRKEIPGMMKVFHVRQRPSEMKGYIVIALGVLISSVLLMLGFTTKGSMDRYIDSLERSIKYEYMYFMKNDSADIGSDSESAIFKTLQFERKDGSKQQVELIGIDKNSRFFPSGIETPDREAAASSAAAAKYGLKAGQKIKLYDELKNREYEFKISKIVDSDEGLYFFMSRQSMKNRFDIDYSYNTVFSKYKLDFNKEDISSVEQKKNIINSADELRETLSMMVAIMEISGLLVFLIVIYVLIGLMIERSVYDIAILKTMGYNKSEIRRIKLWGPYAAVFISCAASIPLSKLFINLIYPYLMRDTAANIQPYLGISGYAGILAYMLICSVIIFIFMNRKLNRISVTEILKERE